MSLTDQVELIPLPILTAACEHANLIIRQAGGHLSPEDFKAVLTMFVLVTQVERRNENKVGEIVDE